MYVNNYLGLSMRWGTTYGTGSSPPGDHGWHRPMRLTPSQIPFRLPYFSIAWAAYSEQVGVYLHIRGQNRLDAR